MKNVFFIWVDDERLINMDAVNCAADYVKFYVCTSYSQAMERLQACAKEPEAKIFISLDHDLGGPHTGYDIAKAIVESEYPVAGFNCHSMNPVGKMNIFKLLTHYGYKPLEFWDEVK